MDEHLEATLDGLADDDREGIEVMLSTLGSIRIGRVSAYAYSLMADRPLMTYRIYAWLSRKEEPNDPTEREDWLRVHNNACHLAIFHGQAQERREIVDRALRIAPDNIAIYHNAACVLCALGEGDIAVEVIREGIAQGYDAATVKAIAEDTDLDLIRHTDAFRAIVDGVADDFTLPDWAEGFSTWEWVQFRELVRTTLPDTDVSAIAGGNVESGGRVFDVVELAAACRGKAYAEWLPIVEGHFLDLLTP